MSKYKEPTNQQISECIVKILWQSPDYCMQSKNFYSLVAYELKLTEKHPHLMKLYKCGRSVFKMRIQAAVEEFRKKNVICKGGKRGFWKLSYSFISSNLN